MQDTVIQGIVLILYLCATIGIGLFFYRKNESQEDYILGNRSLNPWVSALSAQASDMSGWLLMGLPGTAFLINKNLGLSEAFWTALGLAVGTYVNWLFVAKRLRKYSEISKNSITIPSYLESRFRDDTKILRTVSAIFIIIFFLVYTASQFSAGAKLFETVFGLDYKIALVIGAVIIVSYTFLGGFLAVCWTDFIQGTLMLIAIIALPLIAMGALPEGTTVASKVAELTSTELNFSSVVGIGSVSFISIISFSAWGLGYFGQPHIVARFMGISKPSDIALARRIAMVWVCISLFFAVFIGAVGRAYLAVVNNKDMLDVIDSERVFIIMAQELLRGPWLSIIAGLFITAILAAIMSTADSQLLVTAGSVSEDIYKALFKKDADNARLMWVSRGTVILVSIIAAIIAINPDSSVFVLVSFAWAGFGAAFGPVILMSLYWKRLNYQGAVAGVVSGGLTVLIWKLVIKQYINIYEIVPAFLISMICIYVISIITEPPTKEIQDEFDRVLSTD